MRLSPYWASVFSAMAAIAVCGQFCDWAPVRHPLVIGVIVGVVAVAFGLWSELTNERDP
jgi:hypothetical protein